MNRSEKELEEGRQCQSRAEFGLYIMNVAHELVPTTSVVKEITGAFLL